jgi:hypothetical protein
MQVYYFVRVEVQFGHLVALILTLLKQNGHSFVVRGAGAAVFLGMANLAIGRMTKKKITAAKIKKVMIVLINRP